MTDEVYLNLPTLPKGRSVTAPPNVNFIKDTLTKTAIDNVTTDKEVSGSGLPPDTYLGRVHVDTSKKSLKRLIGDTEQYKPWKNHYNSDDFHSWYRWIIDATDLQQLVSKMPMSDAERLYFLMSDMMRNAHRNHTLLGPVCDYSNHGPDCDCGGR